MWLSYDRSAFDLFNHIMEEEDFKKEMWEKLVRLELKRTVLAEQLHKEKQINDILCEILKNLFKPDVYLDVLYRAYKRAIEQGRDDFTTEDLYCTIKEL